MFHINDADEARPCKAKQPSNCKFYNGEDDSRHYDSVSEAQEYIEKKLEEKHGKPALKKVKYSFVKAFKKQEDNFKKDFDGIPTRFFNADLRGKFVRKNDDEYKMNERYMHIGKVGARLMLSTSAPSDNGMPSEEVKNLLTQQGFVNIQEIENSSLLTSLKSQRAWKATLEDKEILVIDGNSGSEVSTHYFRLGNEYFDARKTWTKIDVRKLAGNARAEKKTGINLLRGYMKPASFEEENNAFKERQKALIESVNNDTSLDETTKATALMSIKRLRYEQTKYAEALIKLEDAQLEGKNFIAQKKYIKEHSGSVATVWEDKKDTDDIRKDLMKNSTVKDLFRKIDLDNDVDPSEYREFEKDINSIRDKMPAIPEGLEPELRLRKLGKHSSSSFIVSGLYNPAKNSLGISVTDSSSYIHEMMHFYDLAVKNNASLNEDFREISKEYMKNLKLPEGLASKSDYYAVATEQLARCGEVWASERLNIDNRLINKEKFKNFDYAPIVDNPELKRKVFDFFDKLFEKDMN